MVEGVDSVEGRVVAGATGKPESIDAVLGRLNTPFCDAKTTDKFFDAVDSTAEYIRAEYDSGRGIHPAIAAGISCFVARSAVNLMGRADQGYSRSVGVNIQHALVRLSGTMARIRTEECHPWYSQLLKYVQSEEASQKSLRVIYDFVGEASQWSCRFIGGGIQGEQLNDTPRLALEKKETNIPPYIIGHLYASISDVLRNTKNPMTLHELCDLFHGVRNFCEHRLKDD